MEKINFPGLKPGIFSFSRDSAFIPGLKAKVFPLKIKELLPVILLSIISTLTSGYQYAVSDQEIFIPYIYKIQDSHLFNNDLLFTQFTVNASIFYQAVAVLSKCINIQTIFFLGFLFSKAIFFVGIYYLSKLFFKKREIALVSLLPFLLPKFIGGTATQTFDTFFGYRSIGQIFLVFYLLFLLKRQFIKSSLVAGFGLFFHPLSIIPNLLISPLLIIKNSRNKKKDLLIFLLTILAFSVVYKLSFSCCIDLFKQSSNWLNIIKDRDNYIFVSIWSILGWLSLGMYLLFGLIYLKYKNRRLKGDILTIFLSSLFVLIFNYLIIEIFRQPAIAKFQLARSITPIALISLTLSPFLVLYRKRRQRLFGTVAFISLTLNFFYLVLMSIVSLITITANSKNISFEAKKKPINKLILIIVVIALLVNGLYLKNSIQYPKNLDDWIDLQLWARANTDKNSMFVVPPYKTGFRIFSQRPIIGDIKDGAVVIYSEDFANRWSKILTDLQNYKDFNEADFIRLKQEYHYNYVVVDNGHVYQLNRVYKNGTYSLYKI